MGKKYTKITPPKDHKKQISRNEIDKLLIDDFPDQESLKSFPLSVLFENISVVDPRYYGSESNGHIHRVMEGINILTGKEPFKISQKWTDKAGLGDPICREFMNILDDFYKGKKFVNAALKAEHIKPFLRICAFYHDIGKGIITERHPSVGWHLIKDVHSREVKEDLYPLLLGKNHSAWKKDVLGNLKKLSPKEKRIINLFVNVVKYHDLFGVLSTGEASYPVMMDLIPLIGTNEEEAIELFFILFILNLSDVYGSVSEVHPYKVKYFCDDLKLLCEKIKECEGDRKYFFESLIQVSQGTKYTIKRIKRFLMEGAPKDWQEELGNDPEIIDDAFKNATISGQYKFCKNFALFCKLDYGLSFKIMMMNLAYENRKEISNPVAKIIEYLVQLERQYGDLCLRSDGTFRRLGLQLSGLTRKPANHSESKIGNTICNLLLDSDKGKEWASSECTVWFLEE